MTVLLWILVIILTLHRNRSLIFWLLLSWITTPIASIILLLILGDAE